MTIASWLNKFWLLRCRRESAAFQRATHDVRGAQSQVLSEIIVANRDSEFGKRYGFDQIRNPRDFQSRVPLASYEDHQPWIDRVAAGQQNVLTCEPVRLFQPTSGSTGGEKLVPYTELLRRQFQRGIAAWIADLFSHRPAVCRGRAYWSISPAFGPARQTDGGVTIGFADDAEYLGRIEQFALRRLLVAPPGVSRCADIDLVRYATLLFLVAAEDLSLVSVWNPTFLTVLLESLEPYWESICADLRQGRIRGEKRPELPFSANRRRADAVAAICRSSTSIKDRAGELWPKLALVSCWGDAAASAPKAELQSLLPHVEIQSKGLLATEGFVSLPLVDRPAPALAVRSHFFELLETDASGNGEDATHRCRLAGELEPGGTYRVVLTTGGGLYRYQLHDEIQVVSHLHQCPLIRFVGKSDNVVDLVGEKLNERHVNDAIAEVFAGHELTARFVLMAPEAGRPRKYRLFVQPLDATLPHRVGQTLADDLQVALERNPHYRYATGLGQLAPLEIAWLEPSGPSADKLFADQRAARGQCLGNIKPVVLDRCTEWSRVFQSTTFLVSQAKDRSRTSRTATPATRR